MKSKQAMKRLLGAGLLVWQSAAAVAQTTLTVHVVQPGETLSLIASQHYGDRRMAVALAAENGIGEGFQIGILAGQRLHVPFSLRHKVVAGESWAQIAEQHYQDARQAFAVQAFNRGVEQPKAGSELLIPYPLRHVVGKTASLNDVALLYYGDRAQAGLLRRFNSLSSNRLRRGQAILVPLANLQPTSAGQRTASRSGTADKGSVAAAELEAQLPAVQEKLRRGEYVQTIALTSRLLASPQLTAKQKVVLQLALGSAYVALGMPSEAQAAFVAVLRVQPTLQFDARSHSPKVREMLERARAAVQAAR